MPSLPFQSFEASRDGNLRRTHNRAGKMSPVGDKRRDSHRNSFLFMLSRWAPAITLGTTDLSCGRSVKDLNCRRYAADEMTTQDVFGYAPAKPHTLKRRWAKGHPIPEATPSPCDYAKVKQPSHERS